MPKRRQKRKSKRRVKNKKIIPLNLKSLGNKIEAYPFVEIEWSDIEGNAGWSDTKELNKDYDAWSLFEDLAFKKPFEFNLGCKNRVRFEKSKGQEFSTYSKGFTRWINRGL